MIEEGATFSLQGRFTLSATDEEVLALLYLPIIKGDSFALYRLLLSLAPGTESLPMLDFKRLSSDLDMEPFRLLQAFRRLEGIGLLSSYRGEREGLGVRYLFRLFPPATPKKFFSDIVLSKLLRDAIGTKSLARLRFSFLNNEDEPNGFVDVTCALTDVYTLREDSGDTASEEKEGLEEKKYKSVSDFDKEDFLGAFDKKQRQRLAPYMKDIENLAVLYAIKSPECAALAEKNMDTDDNFYFEGFREDVRTYRGYGRPVETPSDGGRTENKWADVFQRMSPKEYLSMRLNADPPSYMLEEIERLSKEAHLPNALINVAIDYSMRKTNGKFNENYIDKVAYTLRAQNIVSPYEAMVFLNSQDFNKNKALSKKKGVTRAKKVEDQEEVTDTALVEQMKREIKI